MLALVLCSRARHESVCSICVSCQECEAGMYEKFGCVSKEYKARFRTLMFNLQDTKVCLRRQESLASAD